MIGQLRGVILDKKPPQLLVDVAGVGYEVEASMQTFYDLPDIGQEIILHTHLVVREDAQLLYGFAKTQERTLFRTLIKVNGVGPKLALAILSSIEPNRFVFCVQQNDVSSLIKLPGIGKKTAERLVIEMRDKLKDWTSEVATNFNANKTIASEALAIDEAVSALVALGYKPPEATRAVAGLEANGKTSEMLIRDALKQMVE